jgi:hypothetical protein
MSGEEAVHLSNRDFTPTIPRFASEGTITAYTSWMDRRASDWERQRAREIAAAVLDGRTTILEAIRELRPLAHTDAIANEEDRTLVIAIESETDDLPIGGVRKLWAPYALEAKDAEIARAEELYRAQFLEACKRMAEPLRPVNE